MKDSGDSANDSANDSTRERLIAATLAAIEEHKSLRSLSLRRIAKAAGCSHVNVYHHADGLNGLLWLAYIRVLGQFTQYALDALDDGKRNNKGNFCRRTAEALLRFARDHEGLYRLLWFEDLPGPIPPEAMAAIGQASAAYQAAFDRALTGQKGRVPKRGSAESGQLLFAYLQGEVSLFLNRTLEPEKEQAAQAIIRRSAGFWELLTGD